MKHPHGESMMLYAQDAMTTETPWKLWEFKSPYNDEWRPLFEHPQWNLYSKYRRKEASPVNYKSGNPVSPEPAKPHK